MTSRLRTLLGCAALLLASAFGTAGVASAQTITLSGCQSLSAGPVVNGNITITCNTGGGGPNPPSCTQPTLTPAGATLTFSSSCTQGANPITSVTAAGAAQTPQNPSGTYTVAGIPIPTVPPGTNFTITASDGQGGTISKSTFYSVTGGGGGAVDLSACAAMGYPNSAYYDSGYPGSTNINKANVFHSAVPANMPFGNSSALVVRFTTPALGVNDQTNPNFQAWATGSNNNHQATIGEAPCLIPQANSLIPADGNSPSRPVLKTVLSQTPSFTAMVTANGLCNLGAACPNSSTVFLRPNTTYYITLVNKSASWTGAPNCSTGDCDMRWNFNN